MGNAALPKTEPQGSQVKHSELVEVDSLADVPAFSSDEAAAAFWDTHGPTEHFLEETVLDEAPDWLPPPHPRTTPVAIRFDPDTLARLKAIAKKRHKGYQTLLKEFVAERLYEEEKREGIIPPTR